MNYPHHPWACSSKHPPPREVAQHQHKD
uniref:Uncharacterized protein n=1 Tax=Rhizophora mucronata TaxID=61149 RepID=A0A2P2PQ35_RHIMU